MPRPDASGQSSGEASGHRELDDLTLARARRGEDAACRALVERYQRPVFAVLHRMCGPGHDALVEDLAQETFLRVFRALPDFKPGGPARLSTWILTITSRLAIDALRRRPREPILDDGTLSGAVPSDGATDAAAVQASDRRALVEALRAATATLPDEMRLTFVLRACDERSYEEIAAICDVDVGTVKSRLSRARAKLRQALVPYGYSAQEGAS